MKLMSKTVDERKNPQINVVHALEDDVLFLGDLRHVSNLSTIRMSYNSVVYCEAGILQVEIGGNQQVKVLSGQLLLIPTGKLVQPILMSTDVEATALLVSDKMLRRVLGNQITVWNEAMYMKEIYVVEKAVWIEGMDDYTRLIFTEGDEAPFFKEILTSFLRTMFLIICGDLVSHDRSDIGGSESSIRDKEIFNRFLQLLRNQEQKRQKVSYYAGLLHITPKYLSTVCKKVSAKNPMRWITESVMEDCYMYLKNTDLSVKEISNRMGFPNASFFGQYFRDQAGITPIEYRIKQKNTK